jgi:hypothetical protein
MKTLMATAAAISLLVGVSVASAENAPASNDKGTVMEGAPKVKAASHKSRMHSTLRMKRGTRETTGFGGRAGTVGSGRNDPSIHQSKGDRDSRDFPKQH